MDPLLTSVLSGSYQMPVNPNYVHETIVALARYARALEAGLPSKAFGTQEAELPPPPPQSQPRDRAKTLHSFLLNMVAERSTSSRQGSTSEENVCEEPEITALTDTLRRALTLRSTVPETGERFFGLSSNVAFLAATTRVLREASRGSTPTEQPGNMNMLANLKVRPEFWSDHPVSQSFAIVGNESHFPESAKWEKPSAPNDYPLDFPAPDLLNRLVSLFFINLNAFVPLLHRPTFEKGIASGQHLSDAGFANVVLAVCAVASRFLKDDRVLLEGFPSRHSSGYKWYRQMNLFHESTLRPPSLYDVQAFCVRIRC